MACHPPEINCEGSPHEPMDARRLSLLEGAQSMGCDSLVACTPENMFYMTGFWGEGMAVLDGDHTTIVAPGLEAGRAEADSRDCAIVSAGRGAEMVPTVARLLEGSKPCTDCADYSTMLLLQKHMPHVRHAPGPFQDSRMVKDAEEIRTLQQASRIIDGMFELCAGTITPGQTESQLQAVLMSHAAEREMFDTGYPSTLNPLIVAGGPNGALPHAQVTGRRFGRGDLVVVDITLRYRGYVSDATRTFGVGHVSPERVKIYDTVREAQDMGLRAAIHGVSCGDVDRACRDHIESRGYGRYFIHSTGHGVGLEVHEQPTISRSVDTVLRRDMAVTVEPGIYIPGEAGVRIEDSIIVGRGSMHRYTKDLVVV